MRGSEIAGGAPFAMQRLGRRLVVPVPDALDRAGLDALRDAVLAAVSATRARALVFDLSAVTAADSVQAGAVAAIARMARLLGARVGIAAMRPGVAAALAALGFTPDDAVTARTVDDALARLG
ncbi:MAG: STAS domain-containing protein [Acidobacteria bacterium]|nr:MAG: STAS domain-containing protein [Acidobacteriota bacterium]